MKIFAAMKIALGLIGAFSLTAQAADIAIGAGSQSGEYTNTIVPALSAALTQAGDNSATAMVSAGSGENLKKLMSGELQAGLVQLDVLAMSQGESGYDNLQFVDTIAPEALLCAAKSGGKVKTYHNLTDKYGDPLRISVGAEGSGSASTMEFILGLDPKIDPERVQLIYEPDVAAELDRLATGSRDLVCFVMMPNPDNALIKKVDDNDDIKFIDFVSDTALQATIGDDQVYNLMVVPVSPGIWGFGADKVETLTTWVGLVVNKNTDPAMLTALTDAIAKPDLLPPTTPAGKAKKLWADFTDKASELTDQATEKAVELTAEAKVKAAELAEQAKEKAVVWREKAAVMAGQAKEKASELTNQAKEAMQGDEKPAQ
jgi:TRAP-type uncharacterized transport system substrate-binding protein